MLQVLLLGDSQREAMQPAVRALFDEIPAEQVKIAPGLPQLERLCDEEAWFPDIVLVCQSWPRQFPAGDVDRLLRQFPLARWICCYDCWCDSSGRSELDWPPPVRVPIALAESRIRCEIAQSGGTSGDGRLLPLTASRDETYAFDFAVDGPLAEDARHQGALIAVNTPDRALRDSLRALLRQRGFATVAEENRGEPAAVIWDVDPWNAAIRSRLQKHALEQHRAPVLAVTGFPRLHESADVLAAGAAAIVAKLAPVASLFAELDWILEAREMPGAGAQQD